MWMRLDVDDQPDNLGVRIRYTWLSKGLLLAVMGALPVVVGGTFSATAAWDVRLSVAVACVSVFAVCSALTVSVFLSTRVRLDADGAHIRTPMGKERSVPLQQVQFFIHEPFALRNRDHVPNSGNHITAIGTYPQGEPEGRWRRQAASTDPIRFGFGVPDDQLADLADRLTHRLFELSANT